MNKFSQRSKNELQTCHEALRLTLNAAIRFMDFSVLEGHRDKKRQNRLYEENKSQVKYPNSKHNSEPSMAVDVAPYPIKWEDKERFVYLAGIVSTCFWRLQEIGLISEKYRLRYGGDWDSDKEFIDEKFRDYGHFELIDGS